MYVYKPFCLETYSFLYGSYEKYTRKSVSINILGIVFSTQIFFHHQNFFFFCGNKSDGKSVHALFFYVCEEEYMNTHIIFKAFSRFFFQFLFFSHIHTYISSLFYLSNDHLRSRFYYHSVFFLLFLCSLFFPFSI